MYKIASISLVPAALSDVRLPAVVIGEPLSGDTLVLPAVPLLSLLAVAPAAVSVAAPAVVLVVAAVVRAAYALEVGLEVSKLTLACMRLLYSVYRCNVSETDQIYTVSVS
jgi:hypothetical protein